MISAEEEAPSDAEIGAVLDDFEALSFAGLDRQDVHLTAVQHREAGGGVHVPDFFGAPCSSGHWQISEHCLAWIERTLMPCGINGTTARAGPDEDYLLRARLIQPSFDAAIGCEDRTAIKRQIGDHLLGGA